MICCLPFCAKDVAQAIQLLEWIKQLGGCPKHQAFLFMDASVQWHDGLRCLELARQSFASVEMGTAEIKETAWPQASNAMFLAAMMQLKEAEAPFFWCEPDCIPLKSEWMDVLESEYQKAGKPFMGAFVKSSNPGLPSVSLGGCAVYPPVALDQLAPFCSGTRAWDVASAETVIPKAENTKRIQWFWGQPNLPPTFALTRTAYSTMNTFTPKHLGPEAVVFHRNKDGSLIRMLRHLQFPGVPLFSRPFKVILAFCNKDAMLMARNVRWIEELGGAKEYDAVLAHDMDTLPRFLREIRDAAQRCFRSEKPFSYRCGSTSSWPYGANVAFRNSCYRMRDESAFLWLEADAIPVKSGWLDQLQSEYDLCGQPFMGPIVPGMGHMNGVGIYPQDTLDRIPKALSPSTPSNIAWDSAMKPEMIAHCHDAGRLIQHVWGIVDGKPHPRLGDSPVFDAAWKLSNWVLPTAVLFHRNKDGSLIECIKKFRSDSQ